MTFQIRFQINKCKLILNNAFKTLFELSLKIRTSNLILFKYFEAGQWLHM